MMNDPVANFRIKTSGALDDFKKELGSIRTNRPTPAILDGVKVVYYGQTLSLNQVGSIVVLPPRDLVIHVWDAAAIPEVVKAIESANLGLSAAPQGNVVRVHLPELSSERRAELIKLVGRLAEECRIKVRHLRDEANKEVESLFKSGELGEDMKFKFKEKIQEETEKTNKEIETVLERKVEEIQS